MNSDILEAISIISKSQRSGKLLTEYRRWEQLDTQSKGIALSMFDFKPLKLELCPLCQEYKPLTGYFSHMYGTESCCADCSEGNNKRLARQRQEYNSL